MPRNTGRESHNRPCCIRQRRVELVDFTVPDGRICTSTGFTAPAELPDTTGVCSSHDDRGYDGIQGRPWPVRGPSSRDCSRLGDVRAAQLAKARPEATKVDRKDETVLRVAVLAGVAVAVLALRDVPAATIHPALLAAWLGLIFLWCGVALRLWCFHTSGSVLHARGAGKHRSAGHRCRTVSGTPPSELCREPARRRRYRVVIWQLAVASCDRGRHDGWTRLPDTG